MISIYPLEFTAIKFYRTYHFIRKAGVVSQECFTTFNSNLKSLCLDSSLLSNSGKYDRVNDICKMYEEKYNG